MTILKNEFIKAFTSKVTISAIVILLIVNISILFNEVFNSGGRNNFYSSSAYKQIYCDMQGLNNSEQVKFINELVMSYSHNQENSDSGEVELRYTDNDNAEISLFYDVLDNAEAANEYKAFLNDIRSDATLGISMGLFADSDTFAYKNVQKTLKDFEKMNDVETVAGPSKGVVLATENISTDFFVLVAVLVIVVSLVTRERESAGLNLCKSAYNGRLPLAVVKALVIIISSICSVLLFYGINYLFAGLTYGFGDLSRAVQSVPELSRCVLNVSLGEYMLIYLVAKCVAVMGVSIFFYMVAVLCATAMKFYIITVVVSVVSALAYYSIPATSKWVLLKYLNLVAFLDTNSVIGYYRNLNFFGIPVTYSFVFWISSIMAIVLLTYYSCVFFADIKESSLIRAGRLDGLIKNKTGRVTSVFCHELYKCFVSGKILFIIAVYAIYVFGTYKPVREAYYITEDNIYNIYVTRISGPISEDKIEYVHSEVERMEQLEQEKEIRIREAKTSEEVARVEAVYDAELVVKDAVYKLDEHTQYLEMVDGDYYMDTGYKLLTGHPASADRDAWLALLTVLILIVCFSYIYSVEYANGCNVIVRTTVNGRGRTLLYKSIVGIIITLVVTGLTYAPVYYSVFEEFGTRGIGYKACSMSHLVSVSGNISVLEYLIIINILRFVGMVVMMYVIFLMSSKLKSMIFTIWVSLVLFVMPIILFMVGVPNSDKILLNIFLI